MIYLGIDDTDMPDTPGTNYLARHLVSHLAPSWRGILITRHQLLVDPRVPCTRKNGCVAVTLEGPCDSDSLRQLTVEVAGVMHDWCPVGSDPGLCLVAGEVSEEITAFGRRCQQELVTQGDARGLAAGLGVLLQGVSGTQDGVIGALAAVGLVNTNDDGRVIFNGHAKSDHFSVSGVQEVATLDHYGVQEVRLVDTSEPVSAGLIDLGKRLRPVLRQGRVVLYVSPSEQEGSDWLAERIL